MPLNDRDLDVLQKATLELHEDRDLDGFRDAVPEIVLAAVPGNQFLWMESGFSRIEQPVLNVVRWEHPKKFTEPLVQRLMDPIGITRSFWVRAQRGYWAQGGSTITQQLARNVYLNNNRDFGRKLREIILAMAIETKFSKEQILELYLNKVYFGGGAYGVDAASRANGNSGRRPRCRVFFAAQRSIAATTPRSE